jgi:hypothetical protein
MTAWSTLFRKEFRQNSLIFGIPFGFILIVGFLNHYTPDWLSREWLDIISVAVPVALAGAYGLQAFDLEINSQTRDFLLTRPVSGGAILRAKYFSGLTVLLVFSLLWLSILQPRSIVFPDIFDLKSLWFTSFILLVLTIYGSSLAIGLIVKGPKKLLAALTVGFLCAGWLFWGWCEFITSLFLTPWFFEHYISGAGTAVLFSLAAVSGVTYFFWDATRRVLCKIVDQDYKKRLVVFSLSFFGIPLLFFGVNHILRPTIKPFNSLAASFFKLDNWFVALQGVKQPNGDRFALLDGTGRIGLARTGQKAKVVFTSQTAKPEIKALTWSPDGRHLAFADRGIIKTYDPASGKVRKLIAGSSVYWSADASQLLIGKSTGTRPIVLGNLQVPAQNIEFSQYDLKSDSVVYWVQFKNIVASSLCWDSPREQLLALDRSWSLKLIALKHSQIRSIDFLSSLKAYEIISSSQIVPSHLNPLIYDLFICSVDQKSARQNRNQINFRWYTFNPSAGQVILRSTIKDLPRQFKDIIPDSAGKRLLINNGSGVYYASSLIPGR